MRKNFRKNSVKSFAGIVIEHGNVQKVFRKSSVKSFDGLIDYDKLDGAQIPKNNILQNTLLFKLEQQKSKTRV